MKVKKVYAWAVTEGPISVSELCDCGDLDCEVGDSLQNILVLRCSVGLKGELFDHELTLNTFDNAYNLMREIMWSKKPILVGETYET